MAVASTTKSLTEMCCLNMWCFLLLFLVDFSSHEFLRSTYDRNGWANQLQKNTQPAFCMALESACFGGCLLTDGRRAQGKTGPKAKINWSRFTRSSDTA